MSELDYAREQHAYEDGAEQALALRDNDRAELVEMIEELPALRSTGLAHQTVTTLEADPYIGVAAVPFDEKAQRVLAQYQTVPHDWIDIKPNGQIYLSHMRLRAIFNEAFGYGGWGMVPVGNIVVERVPKKSNYPNKPDYEHVTVYREYRLYVAGRFVRQMMGAGDYYTNNAETNYADAVESSESYALNRSGKPFGIASQCWDRGYGEWWKANFAVQRDGKWQKKINTNVGAGAPPYTSSEQPPQNNRTTASTNSASPAPTRPAGGNKKATILLVANKPTSKGKEEWTGPDGVRLAMFLDSDNKSWKFQNEYVGIAKAAVKTGTPLDVEYVLEEGKFRVVVLAERGGEGQE